MAKKKKDKYIVYTEIENDDEFDTLLPEDQTLSVYIEKKNRGGKTATIVRGFIGSDDDLKELGKTLKSKCSTGGSVKDGEIIIQGDVRDKVMSILNDMGYNTKRVGG